jgi:hypothetical protein
MRTLVPIAALAALAACNSNPRGATPDAGTALDAPMGVSVDAPSTDAPPADAGPADVPPVTVTAFADARISSQSDQPNFQRVRAAVDLGAGPFARVTMVVDLRSTCFPFETWRTNRPPAGQNWPADCDAFDRNFEFTLDEPAAMGQPPAVELLRAITPFGGPLHVEVDVTDVFNGLPGAHTLHSTIPTYSDGAGRVSGSNGGWNVTARFEVTRGPAPRRVLAVIPLLNLSHGADTANRDYPFTLPAGTRSGRIEYRVTGHGGGAVERPACIGPAEEFCQREHTVAVDGADLEPVVPWRTDCQDLCTLVTSDAGVGPRQYCLENPCGALASVRAPRANWCPGSATPPFEFTADALNTPGAHTFRYRISRVAASGSWRTSAVVFAYGE